MGNSMPESFEPLERCPVDLDHQLEQTVRQFSSIKNGLPELVKNSKDAYARCGIDDRETRTIVVLLQDGRDNKSSRLGVLDFAGASISDFEGESESDYGGWMTWSSRTASKASISDQIEGGYGNGGKSFMVTESTVSSSMHSSKDGRRTKMGFVPACRFTPGYFFEDGHKIRDLSDSDSNASLRVALAPFSFDAVKSGVIPEKALARKNWTLVELVGVKEVNGKWDDEYVNLVLETLRSHGQCSLTISTSNVLVVKNGKLIAGPISEEALEPYGEFKDPFVVNIPLELQDPLSGELVHFEPGDHLTVNTSKKPLNLRPEWRPRNVLRVRCHANIVAYYAMSQLAPSSVYSHLYGEVVCNNLAAEDLSGQLRLMLNDTKRTRALEAWLRDRLNEIGEKISDAMSERTTLKERLEVGESLEGFRKLMAEFLEHEEDTGDESEGPKPGGGGPKKPRKPGEVDKVLLEGGISFLSIPIGVSIPVRHEAQDAKGRVVPRRHFRWECDPAGILLCDGGGNVEGLQKGKTNLWVVDIDTGLKSNVVEVTVHKIVGVGFSPEKTLLMQGERMSLNVTAQNDEGLRPERLALSYQVLPDGAGRVGRLGFFTSGSQPGKVSIKAIYGKQGAESSVIVEVTEEKKERPPPGWKGGGIPYIVLCDDMAPGCTDLPENERTLRSNPEAPTIIMYEPFWNERGVIWINHASAEARRVREKAPGNAPLSKINTDTFMAFLAMKCFEILKILKAEQQIPKDARISMSEMVENLARAEIEAAPFIDAAFKSLERTRAGKASPRD
jgi:hypothetical protein